MDDFRKVAKQSRRYLVAVLLVNDALLIGLWLMLAHYTTLADTLTLEIVAIAAVVISLFAAVSTANYLLQPLQALWQAIVHLAPGNQTVAAPRLEDLTLGRQLVANLTGQIYQLASLAAHIDKTDGDKTGLAASFIANNLPLPLLVLNKKQEVIFANEVAARYLQRTSADILGKSLYSIMDMSFTSTATFDSWLQDVQKSVVTASNVWERVRIKVGSPPGEGSETTHLFDLAAYFNKDNSADMETILVLFDHTTQYSQDEQAMSFVALSVHELRTPLTLLRGYIEVFEDELGGKLDPQLNDFMSKMSASAQQLAAFVNNILNVARVDADQLVLQLNEEQWPEIITSTVNNLNLRARVRGISIETSIAPNLPSVGVDRVSIYEVLSNLIDNAIKYSGKSKRILVSTYLNKEGLIETSVQDFGVGISSSILPNLFNKFYRSHQNRAQIGGTGLGLYLAKAIISAHGGNIWIRSKEGAGTVVSFTLMPFNQLAVEQKNSDNKEIVRGAHGWIKNHSLYRR